MKFSLIYSPVSFWENWIAKYTSFRYSSDIWIPISLEKKCGPNQVITYFGYELDSTIMKCTFRKEKKVQNIQFAFEQNKFNIKASSFTHILIEFCMQCSNAW